MSGKTKYIGGIFMVTVVLCLLSSCGGKKNDTDMETEKMNSLTERENLIFKENNIENQATENASANQSNEAASKEDKNMSVMEAQYKKILLGAGDFINIDIENQERILNLKNIKEVVSDADEVTARITKFAIIDLDGDGENEIVLWIQVNEHLDFGFEILDFHDQEVYGFTLWYRQFMELKADGTFQTSGGAGATKVCRLQLLEKGYIIEEAVDSESQEDKTNVEWYDLTPESVELAFENKF